MNMLKKKWNDLFEWPVDFLLKSVYKCELQKKIDVDHTSVILNRGFSHSNKNNNVIMFGRLYGKKIVLPPRYEHNKITVAVVNNGIKKKNEFNR